MYIQAGLGLLV